MPTHAIATPELAAHAHDHRDHVTVELRPLAAPPPAEGP